MPPAFDEEMFLRFLRFLRTLDERQARRCAAERALTLGRGGITRVARVTGLSHPTIRKGIAELRSAAPALATGRIRRVGGGRKRVEVACPAVLTLLQEVVDASTAGSPTDVLRWTSKSKTNLAEALAERGYRLAPNSVGRLLRELGYSLQAKRQDKEGRSPPERAAQVALPERPGARVSGTRPTGHVGGHEEEGVGGRLQACRAHLAAERPADPGAAP